MANKRGAFQIVANCYEAGLSEIEGHAGCSNVQQSEKSSHEASSNVKAPQA